MAHYPDFPFDGFQGFLKTLKEIATEQFPEWKELQRKIDEAKPSTEFGINGLGLREEFQIVTHELETKAGMVIANDGPETSLGGYIASTMAARHSREGSALERHLKQSDAIVCNP